VVARRWHAHPNVPEPQESLAHAALALAALVALALAWGAVLFMAVPTK
jgi:hypothetical protein